MKSLILAALLSMAAPCVGAIAAPIAKISIPETGDSSNLPSVTVYKITVLSSGRAAATTRVSAKIDMGARRLYVGGNYFTIHENRHYGQTNDPYSDYKWVAGDYYFNY